MLVVLGASVVWWSFRARRLDMLRTRTATVEAHHTGRRETVEELEARLDRLGQEIETAKRANQSLAILSSETVRQIDHVPKDLLYSQPPAELPDWNPDSPYVWIRKEIVPAFPFDPFRKDGQISPELALILDVDHETVRALNGSLIRIVRAFEQIAAAKAEFTDEHLAGIASQEGTPMTVIIRPMPEEGRRHQDQFETEVLRALGEQRGRLVLTRATGWMDSTFSQAGNEPATISVLRRPDDTYGVSVKRGSGWFNTSGIKWDQLQNYVPAYLLPRFATMAPAVTRTGK